MELVVQSCVPGRHEAAGAGWHTPCHLVSSYKFISKMLVYVFV